MSHRERIERVKQELGETGKDAYIAVGSADAAYLSGHYDMGPGGRDYPVVVVPAEGEPLLLVSPLSEETAVREATISVRTPDEGFAAAVTEIVDGPVHLGSDASARFHERLADDLPVELDDDILPSLRATKTVEERETIREAYRVTEEAIAMVDAKIEPGQEERRIAAELEYAMRVRGSMGTGFPTIVATDTFTSVPHHATTDAAVTEGPVLFDVGAVIDGYRSDMTRTFHLGEPSDTFIEVYETVLEAQEAAASALRAGIPASEVDEAARAVIKDAGYGDAFPHSTGHGVGLDVHEQPNLSHKNDDPVPEDAVVTIEPGIYMKGELGVRIEDAYHVTADGADRITRMDRQLEQMILDRD